jgi:ankyrin repeat protein
MVTKRSLMLVAVCCALLLTACSREYNSELMSAAKGGDIGAVENVLSRSADINEQNNKGKTALMFAASEGRLEVVRLLLERGANANVADHYGTTALIVAATAGHQQVVSLLLDNGADPNVRDDSGSAPLVNAVYFGHTDTVKVLLANKSLRLEKQDGEELLMLAAGLGHSAIVRVMIDFGVDANGRGLKQRTPLMAAAYFNRPAVAQVLLELGADPAAHDADGNTASDVAREKGSDEVLTLLSSVAR